MPSRHYSKSRPPRSQSQSTQQPDKSCGPWLFLAFLCLLTYLPASPAVIQTGTILLGLALLPWLYPATAKIPRAWIILTGIALLLGFGSFLPANLFPVPAWRTNLEAVALPKVPSVVIQWKQALEQHAVFICVIAAALSLLGRRASSSQAKNLAFALVVAAAIWSLLAILLKSRLLGINMNTFGFFPNRNHTGTYLAITSTCGIGVVIQAIKDKDWGRLTIACFAEAILVFAIFTESISRAGLLLCAVGVGIWFLVLGVRYWSATQLKAIGLILLLAIGVFAIAETTVKSRLAATIERTNSLDAIDITEDATTNTTEVADFRVMIARDTFSMIADAPLTGVGAGQFPYIFPQYRNHSILSHFNEGLHPESDWLWLASEYGLPATGLLFTLVICVFTKAWKSVRRGRDRALRGACLAAAALVPIHGFVDVPAHRPALLLLSAFLLMAAFDPAAAIGRTRRAPWASRLGPLIPLGLALRYLCVSWFGLSQPYSERAAAFLANQATLRRDITTPLDSADPLSDMINRRLELRDTAWKMISDSPMERRLYTLAGISALSVAPESEETRKALEMDLLLDPTQPQIALHQANEWRVVDKTKTVELWATALARAEKIDSITGTHSATSATRSRIRKTSARDNALKLEAQKFLKKP